ncbi:MAG: nucleotide exchange factor GrpE [Candidatus Auribacterota bacterium]|jgi:molecular chaperone GrpE|nr:nucleotide exchange factor GrpE [Candidatus Auribacterota bacterium]
MKKDRKHEQQQNAQNDEKTVEQEFDENQVRQEPQDTDQQEETQDQDGTAAPEDEKQKDYFDQMLRIQAEFDNYRKRINRERDEFRKYAVEQLLLELLPIIDNFRLALTSLEEHVVPENHKFFEGVEMIYRQLCRTLEKNGVQAIETIGKPFDPCYHNALQQIESSDVPENHVLHEVAKGYMMHGKLLRPAAVVVAKEPASDGSQQQQD